MAPSAEHATADAALLRRYEPALRLTEGELFLPASVEAYVAASSLWVDPPGEDERELVPADELTLDRLADAGATSTLPLHLRFVQSSLGRREYRAWRKRPRPRLRRTGRFGTVGLIGRLADAAFRASLLARGKVPGGHIAAAETIYRERIADAGTPYYGRVVREAGWVILQYWIFYAMNDWRSTFGGVNDHEADWEMVAVYLSEEDGGPVPRWVGFSSHDHVGDDLRRRWDDPALGREGDHPVVYAGAGSHSGAFVPGDYVTRVDTKLLRWLAQVLHRVRRPLAPWREVEEHQTGLGIPYVDYARGDGPAIGGGGTHAWSAVVVGDDTPWVRDFRGLWGLDTGDPLGGERAPAGPRYERDGSVRRSWADPLGWAGLHKVPPSDDEARRSLERRIEDLAGEEAERDARIATARREARALEAARVSLGARGTTRAHRRELDDRIDAAERDVEDLVRARAALAEERRLHVASLAGDVAREAPQAHVRNAHAPMTAKRRSRHRALSVWAAVSAPLLIASLILVFAFPTSGTIGTFLTVMFWFGLIESAFRGRVVGYLVTVGAIVLLVVTGIVLAVVIVVNWRIALAVVLGVPALALLVANLRELARR